MDTYRLFGVGLGNSLALFVFFVLLIVGSKALLAKYPVSGLTEVIHAV